MGLNVYTFPVETSKIESDEYISISFNGTTGGTIDKKLYVRNDDLTLWFSDIQVKPYDSSANFNPVYGPEWEIRVLEKDVAPTIQEWLAVDPGNQIDLSANIGTSTSGDIATYLPFWIRITVPRNQAAQNISSVVIRINAASNLVGE